MTVVMNLTKSMGDTVMATKHEQILKHIESLEVGSKISVRQVAKELEVSEGTATVPLKRLRAKAL